MTAKNLSPRVETDAPERAAPQPSSPEVASNAASLFFDAAPVFAFSAGVVSITLAARRYLPDGAGGVLTDSSVVGFLRCSVPAAIELKTAIDKALLLAEPTGNVSN